MRLVRQLLLCLIVLALSCGCSLAVGKTTVDPNSRPVQRKAAVKPDPRLAQRVSYEAEFETVEKIIGNLVQMSGVKLYSGTSPSDWPVRSRRMNIFVKDAKLSDLMDSIGHTMKFKWIRNDDFNPPIYRLIADTKATADADARKAKAEKQSEEMWQKRRKEWLDIIMKDGAMSAEQVEATRDTDPVFYRYARGGALRGINALFNEVPEAKNRYIAGQRFRISFDELSQNTADALWYAGDEFCKFMERGRWPVVGFGDDLKRDEKFDMAYCRLDVDSFTPNQRWGDMTQGCTGYFHFSRGERDWEIIDLKDKNAEWTLAMCMRENLVIDTSDRSSGDAILDAGYPKLDAYKKKEEQSLYPSEPLNKHADFDELRKAVTIHIEPPKPDQNPVMATNEYVASLQQKLAEATGMGVVSDSWVSVEGEKLPETEMELGALLAKFSENFDYNWDKSASILEFRHRMWWKNRLNQIPQDWVARWSENTRKNKMLSLDDLAQISNLTYYQAEESLKTDKILGLVDRSGLYRKILNVLDTNGNLHCLRLYSTLTPQLRVLVTSKTGLNGFTLTSSQWKLAQNMFDRIGSTRVDATFRLEQVPNPTEMICQFVMLDPDTDKEDRKWVVVLPQYVEPVVK